MNKYFGIIVSLLIGLLAGSQLLTNQNFSLHDESQMANLKQYQVAFDHGQFPPRWASDVHFGKGSPYLSFNYQIPYYIAYVINQFGFDLFTSYKLTLLISLLLGTLGAYLLCRTRLNSLHSIIGALFYSTIPYHAIDVYVRGTIGESYAIALFPWVLLTFYRLIKSSTFRNGLLFGLSFAFLILSHQPSTLLLVPILMIISLSVMVSKRNFSILKPLMVAVTTSLAISAYYWIPILAESKLIEPVAPFNFYDHFPFITQLIYSPWGFDGSIWGPDDGMSFRIGFAGLFVVAFFIAQLTLSFYRKKFKLESFALFLSVLLVLFLMNIRSSFLWNEFGLTSLIQFPWRLLSVFSLVLLLLFIDILATLTKPNRILFSLIILGASLFLDLRVFHPGTITDHNDCYYLRRYLPSYCLNSDEYVSTDYLGYTENYIPLPLGAVRQPANPSSKFKTLDPKTEYSLTKVSPFNYELHIKSENGDTFIFDNFSYPGWHVYVNGQKIYTSKTTQGTLQFSVPNGAVTAVVKFEENSLRQSANLLSVVSIISLIYLLWNKKLA